MAVKLYGDEPNNATDDDGDDADDDGDDAEDDDFSTESEQQLLPTRWNAD